MEMFIALFILIAFILIVRLFGAWMLRINDVIDELKGLRGDIRSIERDYYSGSRTLEKKCPMCSELVKDEAKICKHCRYEFPEPKIEETIFEEMPDNLGSSKKHDRNRIIAAILTGVIIVSFVIFYIVSYVDLNESWRQPTSLEVSELSTVLNEHQIASEKYYVKKISSHEYFIAFKRQYENWNYREIDTDMDKMYFLSEKTEQKLKPPE